MVNLTRIYTRTGDAGQTRLGDNWVASKHDLRLHAYADVDEANAHLGLAVSVGASTPTSPRSLTHVQNDLFDVGADLCTPVVADPEYPPLRVEQAYVDRLEDWCDHYNESLEALRSFILSGGTPGSAHLHVCPHGRPPRGALGLGGVRRVRRVDEPAGDDLPQPALRPALHPGPLREPRAGRRPLGARRGAEAGARLT